MRLVRVKLPLHQRHQLEQTPGVLSGALTKRLEGDLNAAREFRTPWPAPTPGHTDRSNAGTTATYNHSQELPDVLGQSAEGPPCELRSRRSRNLGPVKPRASTAPATIARLLPDNPSPHM